MELKIVCQCGQKYKFDVEPVGGRMPFTVNCPVCQADGTMTANMRLAEHFRFVPPPPQASAPPPVAPNPAAPPPVPPPPYGACDAASLNGSRAAKNAFVSTWNARVASGTGVGIFCCTSATSAGIGSPVAGSIAPVLYAPEAGMGKPVAGSMAGGRR